MKLLRVDDVAKKKIDAFKRELAAGEEGISPADISDNDIIHILLELKEKAVQRVMEAEMAD